jgi:pSer/pThr/pTyr-binding forkhead associated (FHA) protein
MFVDNGRCYVEDLGSSNGVIVDGQRVLNQRDLGTASQIKVGDFYLYVEYQRPDRGSQANVLQTLFISDDSDHHKLVRINDSFAGEEFSLSEIQNTIGRTDDNFILLSDASISRHHAQILRKGDEYTLMDMGSSNGTRINGKTVDSPVDLKPGDRVHFGNVEFVFVPGFVEVNPAEYAKAAGGNLVVMISLGVLILVGVVIGGLIALGFFSMKEEPKPIGDDTVTQDTVESRFEAAMADGRSHMKQRDWDSAIESFDDALALNPMNGEAQSLKEQAELEQSAAEMFDRGEAAVADGRPRDAVAVFESVPEGTVAHDRATEGLLHARATVAYNLRNDATRLAKQDKKSSLKAAHDKIVEALEYDPADEESLELLDEIETTLEKKKIDFEPWNPPETE